MESIYYKYPMVMRGSQNRKRAKQGQIERYDDYRFENANQKREFLLSDLETIFECDECHDDYEQYYYDDDYNE